jgi:hypothetical protein
MGETIGKIVVEIGKALGKAVIAGVGLELARVASGHVKKRFGPKDDTKKDDAKKKEEETLTPEEQLAKAKAENEELRAELERIKQGG